MDQLLETELNEVFSSYASRIPADTAVRLRAVDYKPRTGHLSPCLTVGALGGVAATAGTVISVVVLGGAQPAFAGWSASPTPATAAQLASADAACQAKFASAPASPGTATPSSWSAAVTDVRGPYTMAIFQDGSANATCFIGPSFTAVSFNDGSSHSMAVGSSTGAKPGQEEGGSASTVGGIESGDITQLTESHLDLTGDGPYTLVEGQIQPDVTGVTLVRSDGSDVQATTGGGWLVAWWPAAQGVTSAEVTTPSGVTNQTLNLDQSAPPVPPAGSNGPSTAPPGG
jgi:hypothetical protein